MAEEVLDVNLPAQAAAAADVVTELGALPSQESDATVKITKLSLVSPTLVTGVVTNNAAISFRKISGGVTTIIGTLALGAGVNLPAETEVNVPVTVPDALPGDVIDVLQHQVGTGLALPAGIVAKVETLD